MRLPTIISLYALAEGVCFGYTCFSRYRWSSDGFASLVRPVTLNDIGNAGMCLATLAFVALSYPVFRARDWARRTLVWFAIALGVTMVLSEWGAWRDYSTTFDWRWLNNYLGFLASPLFLAALLYHPAVAAAFRASGTNASNQAMQRTADRSDV